MATSKTFITVPAERFSVKFVSMSSLLRRFAESMSREITRDVLEAGVVESPFVLVSRYLFYAVISALIVTPLALVLTILLNPVCIIAVVFPILFLTAPKLQLRSRAGDRRRTVETDSHSSLYMLL